MAGIATGNFQYRHVAPSRDSALASLSPVIRGWFADSFAAPTIAQRFAWSAIHRGENLLLASATGSGKTLAAALPIISTLDATDPNLRCLYIVPTKSLANDVYKTLQRCVKAVAARASDTAIHVGFRTGDSSAKSRRELFSHPPHILITTPESLAVLLTNATASYLLATVKHVVVDELHSLAPSKRGADLSLSLERLNRFANEPQRIGLSATCAPLHVAAEFLVGTDRSCVIAHIPDRRQMQVTVEPLEAERTNGFMKTLLQRLEPEFHANDTTLVFANTRNLAERLTWALRRKYPHWGEDVAVHHSALSKTVRRSVEKRLKDGTFRIVVSSTSLELGVDFSSIDQVVLVHPPGGVSRLIQRIGRSGHNPGETRRGLILTSSPSELLEAAVTTAASFASQFEPLTISSKPLDVLCQHIASMAINEWWTPTDAYDLLRRAAPYRDLSWDDFQSCLDYLSGRLPDGNDWLPARLTWQNEQFTIADERTSRLIRRNLGTILTEDQRSVRLIRTDADGETSETKIGEVEEPFADRLQPGDRFVLDGRCFSYKRKKRRSLLVEDATTKPQFPKWTGAGWPLSHELARRLYQMRIAAAEALRDGEQALAEFLCDEYALSDSANRVLCDLFVRQEQISEIPSNNAMLVESIPVAGCREHYFHTPLARPGNEALARVAAHRLSDVFGINCTTLVADLGWMMSVASPRILTEFHWETLFATEHFETDLSAAIEGSSLLKERFRSVATIGLMLLRNPIGGKKRVGGREWAERRLFEQIRSADSDFVLLRQSRNEIDEQWCDKRIAMELLQWKLPYRIRVLDRVSPLAEHWTQTAVSAVEVHATPKDALNDLHTLLTSAS